MVKNRTAMSVTVAEWISRYQDDAHEAMRELLNFILKVSLPTLPVCCPPPQSAARVGVENMFLTCPVSAGVRLSTRGQQGGVPQAGHWSHPGQNCGGREVQSGMPSP
jgi:hypothetical protein